MTIAFKGSPQDWKRIGDLQFPYLMPTNRKWTSANNRHWSKAIKPGTMGKIKFGEKHLTGKQIVYVGKMSGYEWFKLLEDAKGGDHGDMERGQVFVYMHKYVDYD